MFKWIIEKIAGNYNENQITVMYPLVEKINEIDASWDKLSDEEIKAKTEEFKQRIQDGETLDELLPEAFANVKQACKRMQGQQFDVKWNKLTWDMVPYDVQLVWGICLHQGNIAEMKTWEWKTLVATLPAYLNALSGKWVHVVTVNDYLTERDAIWMGSLYGWLWLECGYVTKNVSVEKRKDEYAKDITYVENSDLGFDYLRDNLVKSMDERMLLWRPLNFAIVDEVDSILIDEARTPLIISQSAQEPTEKYVEYAKIVKFLKACPPRTVKKKSSLFASISIDEMEEDNGDYEIDEKSKSAMLTSSGIEKLEEILQVENLYKDFGYEEIHHIENALRAMACYRRDKEYMVDKGEILIIDEHTGRTMQGRRYSQWLHQAIEAKEKVRIQNESITMATITYQNFFKQYDKLSGMTGTAATEWEEFEKIYELEVLVIPTNKEIIRVDKKDLIFFNQDTKFRNTVETIQLYNKVWVPMLVGTSSVKTSEILSGVLRKKLIQHYVLNAKLHEQESNIISNAGKLWSVVVATNMAGRGTDIKLDKWLNQKIAVNYAKLASQQVNKKAGISFVCYSRFEYDTLAEWIKDEFNLKDEDIAEAGKQSFTNDNIVMKVKFNNGKAGKKDLPYAEIYIRATSEEEPEIIEVDAHFGLYVLATEKHESRRIDNQLRGRSWRQWDPGNTQFYLALDDDIMVKTWGLITQKMAQSLLPKEELEKMSISTRMITGQINSAQKQLEWQHFSTRKQLFDYDSVLSKQREAIYAMRDQILLGENMHNTVLEYFEPIFKNLIKAYERDTDILKREILEITGIELDTNELKKYSGVSLVKYVIEELKTILNKKIEKFDEEKFEKIERDIMLSVIDKYWVKHIDDLSYLRDKVSMYWYAQMDPLIQYKKEGYDKYITLLSHSRTQILSILFKSDFGFLEKTDNIDVDEIDSQRKMVNKMRGIVKEIDPEKFRKVDKSKAPEQIVHEKKKVKKWPRIIEKTDDIEVIELDDDDIDDDTNSNNDIGNLIDKMVKG